MLQFFVEFWKWKLFFKISLAIPRPLLSRVFWPISYTKKNEVSGYKKKSSLNRNIHPVDSWPYIGAIIYLLVTWYFYWCHCIINSAMVFILVSWYWYWCYGIDISAMVLISGQGYIEVGANTLKSSSTFQLPTKIIFSLKKKKLKKKCVNFFGRTKHTYCWQNMYSFKFLKTVIGACF